MKIHLRKYFLPIGIGMLALTLSACVTDRHESLRMSASRLDDASSHFFSQIRYQGDDSVRDHISRDAEAMARTSHKLDQDLNDHERRSYIEDDYRQVQESYDELHRQLADEGYAEQNRRVLQDFDRITTTYHDVQAAFSVRNAAVR